jgi:hemolysin activation/secretion protein
MPLRRWFIAVVLAVWRLPLAAQEEPRFDLLEFEVVGNSVLEVVAVERAVLPFLGEGRSVNDVEAARTALEKAYQDAGFMTVLVDVPEQRVAEGVVQLRVVEGRIERLRVTGSRYYDQGFIRDRVDQLAPGRVPDFNAMQRQLAQVNREERQVQPLLRPGLAPGTVEAELRVNDKLPLSGTVEVNNRHAADTSRLRAMGTVRYDNLFQLDHSLALTAITAPLDVSSSRVITAGYTAPLEDGRSLAVSLLVSDSRVEPLGAAIVFGKGATLSLRWLKTLPAAQSLHTLSAGFDIKDFRERVVADSSELSTPLRYMPFSLGYNGNWFGEQSATSFSSTFTAGLRGWWARRIDCPGNVSPVDQFACKREGADGSFSSWRNEVRQTWGGWSLRLTGLLATQPLVSSEQFTIGGADSVRGYYEAEASGDTGLLGTVEWRSGNFAKLFENPDGSAPLSQVNALAFLDAGRVQTLQAAAGQKVRTTLTGAGVGLRLRAAPSFNAELDLAWPFRSTQATPDSDLKLHVRLQAQF